VAARGRIFHGWWIVAAAFVSHAVNVGLMFYAWSVFLTPLAAEFGGRGPTGYLRDLTGSFGPALGTIVIASLVAAVVVLQVRLPVKTWRR
jgi:hypothetical protein